MEQSTLLQIARLRTLAARKGKPFDVVRFASDREFSRATLKSLLDTEDEELIVAGLKMMETLHLTAGTARPVPTAPVAMSEPAPPVRPARKDPKKYVGGLR